MRYVRYINTHSFIHSFIPNLGIKAEIGVQDFAPETLREILNSAKIKLLKTRFSFTRFVHLHADGAISPVTYLPETPLLKYGVCLPLIASLVT